MGCPARTKRGILRYLGCIGAIPTLNRVCHIFNVPCILSSSSCFDLFKIQHSLRLKIQAKKNGWEAKRLVREEKYQRKQEEKENALRRKQQKAHKKQQRIELDAVRLHIYSVVPLVP